MSHNTGTRNHIEEERKMIRVQSVLALCERCPAIKSTYKGFANKDTIAPLPHTERIPDPVAIIAKNLSKERKHYLQKVRARGMPERFSVSLAKPRDWRTTVKVRAPKRRQMRLKVEEQREREEELERRQRHRRREGLVGPGNLRAQLLGTVAVSSLGALAATALAIRSVDYITPAVVSLAVTRKRFSALPRGHHVRLIV